MNRIGVRVLISVLAFLFWNYAGARVPAQRIGLVLYLIPVVCVAAGAAFLGETLTREILFGGALTVFGVWVAARVGSTPNGIDRKAIEPAG